MKSIAVSLLLLTAVLLTACDPFSFMPQADEKFADQGYKSTIALIELYRIRNGNYPTSLSAITFTGEWDQIYRQFVSYKLRENGYELHLRKTSTLSSLHYPPEFWRGLGMVATNVEGFPGHPISSKVATP